MRDITTIHPNSASPAQQGQEILYNVDLSSSDAPHVAFMHDDVPRGIHLDHANWYHLMFSSSSMRMVQGTESILLRLEVANGSSVGFNLQGADIRGAKFLDSDVHESIFYGVDFGPLEGRPSCFINSDFSGAVFVGTNLAGSIFIDANVSGADFRLANLSGADLRGAEGLTLTALYSAAAVEGALVPFDTIPTDLQARGVRPRHSEPPRHLTLRERCQSTILERGK